MEAVLDPPRAIFLALKTGWYGYDTVWYGTIRYARYGMIRYVDVLYGTVKVYR